MISYIQMRYNCKFRFNNNTIEFKEPAYARLFCFILFANVVDIDTRICETFTTFSKFLTCKPIDAQIRL